MRHTRRRRQHPDPSPPAARPPELRVSLHHTDGDLLVQPSGVLCAQTADILRAPLTEALRAVPAPRLVLDLSATRLADRFGLGVLMAVRSAARQVGGRLILVHADPELRALLADTGLDRHLHCCTSVGLTGTRMPVTTQPGQLFPVPLRKPTAEDEKTEPDATRRR